MVSRELDKIKKELVEVSENILKIYEKLEKLSLEGKKDTLEYNEIKNLLSCLKRIEEEKYSEIYKNRNFFIGINNYWIVEIHTLLKDSASFDLFFEERDLLPYLRIYNKFMSYIWKSQYFDQIYNLESEKERENAYLEFLEILSFNGENRILEKLLLEKMNSFSLTDKKYELLNRYYYTLIYTTPMLDNNFIYPDVDESNYTFGEFMESISSTKYKVKYSEILLEEVFDSIQMLINQFSMGLTIDGGYAIFDMMPLYFTLIDAKLSILDQDSLVQIDFDIEHIINKEIPNNETNSIQLAKRAMLDYQTKEFIKKYQNKNT